MNIALRPTALAVALLASVCIERAAGDAAVNFNSTIGSSNQRSDGSPMGGEFEFQLGTFATGFSPAASNTGQWLENWVPLCDAAGDPLAGATASYEVSVLQSPPFPADMTREGFAGSASFDHNKPPFTVMGAVYIWGYDNRESTGPGEWILVTSSTWGWPSGTSNPPAETFSIGGADSIVLGTMNGEGFLMQSAAVEVTGTAPSYDGWLAAHFDAAQLADPALATTLWGVLADPDADGLSNVIEYFTASDPKDPASTASTSAGSDGEFLIFSYHQAKDTTGVMAQVEWSTDLDQWHTDDVSIDVVEDLGDRYRVEARIPMANAPDKFARLRVQRVFE